MTSPPPEGDPPEPALSPPVTGADAAPEKQAPLEHMPAAQPPEGRSVVSRVGQAWRALVVTTGFVLQPVLLISVLFVLLQAPLGFVKRSFVVDAVVTEAAIEFVGDRNAWRLEQAILCTPKSGAALRRLVADAASRCGVAFDDAGVAPGIINWPAGSKAKLRMIPGGPLEIEATAMPGRGAGAFAEGAVLLLDADSWRATGALTFTGKATFGGAMGANQKGYLVAGRYEIREKGGLTRLVSDLSRPVKSGTLTKGDQVTIVSADDANDIAVSYGHVTLVHDPKPGFHMVAISAPRKDVMHINTYASSQAIRVRPNWIDSLGSDPLVLALVVLAAVVANLIQLHQLRK